MKTYLKELAVLYMLITSLSACKKSEGYGGKSGIKGVLTEKIFNNDYTLLKKQAPLADEYIYIVFKDGNGYGDKVKTSFDGSFVFTHLNPGKYKIFAYSEDTTKVSSGKIAIIKEIEITKRKMLVDLGELVVSTNDKISGDATIKGKVIAHDNGAVFLAVNEKVFFVYEGDETYTNYQFTNDKGEFVFTDIPIGMHRIYVFSKDTSSNNSSPLVAIEQNINITMNNEIEITPDIHINK